MVMGVMGLSCFLVSRLLGSNKSQLSFKPMTLIKSCAFYRSIAKKLPTYT